MRKKVSTKLKSWDDVDQTLRVIGEIDLLVQEQEARLNEAIMKAKQAAAQEAAFHLEQKKNLEASIRLFAEEHREDLGDRKSNPLFFGTVSFRKSTKIITIANLKRVLELLKVHGLKTYIRTKETVDKEAMGALDDVTLKQVGCRRKIEDVFGYAVDYERIKKGEAA